MASSSKTHAIETRRYLTEARLQQLLAEARSAITLARVKQALFEDQATDARPFIRYMVEALGEGDTDSLSAGAIPTIQDAWNYFPRAALNGRCPAEVYFKESRRLPE